MIFNPSFETFLEEGDTVIAMGRARDLISVQQGAESMIIQDPCSFYIANRHKLGLL